MRLYNAPRIVKAQVTQDMDGDGAYEHSLYSMDFGGYSYNPGNSTDYSTGGNRTSGVGGSKPIKVLLHFSARMNNNYSDFYVNLLGSDGTTVNIPGTWSSGYFANDTWSGTVNIPENFPDGQTKIAVRAKRFSAAGLDEYYQDLDLIGTGGPALNTVDRSVGFKLDRTPPYVYPTGATHGFFGPLETNSPVLITAGENSLFLTDAPAEKCVTFPGVCEAYSGITKVTITSLKTGAVVGPFIVAPPAKEYVVPSFDMPEGNYTIELEDAAGNKTKVLAKAAPVSLEVSTAASRVEMTEAGSFTATFHYKAVSQSGLRSFDIYDDKLEKIATEPVPDAYPAVTIQEGDIAFTGNTEEYLTSRNISVGFTDTDGRSVWIPINLTFNRAQDYVNTTAAGHAESFETAVTDLMDGDSVQLPGAVMSIYAPTREEVDAGSKWWWESRNGFYGVKNVPDPCPLVGPNGERECRTYNAGQLPYIGAGKQMAGKVLVLTSTWDKTDKSDIVTSTVADRELFVGDQDLYSCGDQQGYEGSHGLACYTEFAGGNRLISLKRYVQTKVTIEKVSPSTITVCGTLDTENPKECSHYYDYAPNVIMAGPNIYGLMVKMGTMQQALGVLLRSGHDVSEDLPGGRNVVFGRDTVFTPGLLRYGYASVSDYPGYANLSWNLAFELKTEARFDHAKLTLPYNAAGLTGGQEAGIKIYQITDNGLYVALGTTVDAVNKKVVSSELNSFGRFLVAAPRYVAPQTVGSEVIIAGRPELEFTAEGTAIEQTLYTSMPEGAALRAAVAQFGVPLGNVYKLGPEDLTLGIPGTLKLHYDPTGEGADAIKSLSIYRAGLDGAGPYKLPGAFLDPVNNEIAVELSRPSGLYILVGHTAPAGLDDTPPEVAVSYGAPRHETPGGMYISRLTPVSLSAIDAGPGPVALRYLVDVSPVLQPMGAYTAPFTLAAGVRTIYYSAIDNAGNTSQVSSSTVYVDGMAPEAEIFAGGTRYQAGATIHITSGDSVTFTATDPALSGSASGLSGIYYAVDEVPTGNYENNLYAAPFTLLPGTHTIYYTAVDNVGNMAQVQSVFVTISAGDVAPPQTMLRLTGQQTTVGGLNYIPTSTTLELIASDVESGVATTYYLLDGDPASAVGLIYSVPFSLEEGSHTLHYRSADKAGNYETWNSTVVYVDGTGPASWHSIAGLALAIDGHNYVSLNSTVSVGALDQEVRGAASGVESVYLSLNGAHTMVGSSYTVIPSSEGLHSLAYYAVDKVGNTGAAGTYAWRVDATAPVTDYAVAGSSFNVGGLLWVKAGAALFLAVEDPVSNGAASGAQDTWYSLDGGVDAPYGMTPLILGEGTHTLGYFSGDRAGNMEEKKYFSFAVDGTAPALGLTAGRAVYSESNAWYGTSRDTFTVSAADAGCGLAGLEVSLNDGAFAPATGGAFGVAFAAEGRNKVVARTLDNLGNAGGATYYLIIDDTPPDFSGSRQIRWEAEDPSNTITPAGSLVLADGGLKLYGGVSVSTNQHTVLYSGDSLPAQSTPAWSRAIMGTPYTFTETITDGVYSVSGAGWGGNGVTHWRSESNFLPGLGWSYEMRPRVPVNNYDNSVGFYVSEGNGYYIWLQFRHGYVWVSLVPGGDVYLSLDAWNFHNGKLAREGDYLRFYLDGVLKVSSYYPTPVGLPAQPAAKPFLNSFSVSYGNFGGQLDWMKYTFFARDTVAAGALSGVFETPFVPLGEVSAVRNFVASDTAAGSRKYEYSTDGTTYREVSRLGEADVAAGRIKLRGTLTRAALSDESPVADAMNFELARLVETSTPIAGPFGGPAEIAFIASERTNAVPSVEVAVGTAAAGAAGDAANVPPSLIWNYNYNVPAGAPSGAGVINIGGSDLSGNAGSDGSGRIAIDALGPNPVNGLVATTRSTYSITLAWPATTDRGGAGAVKDYLVGYSASSGSLSPGAAGITVAAGVGGGSASPEGLLPGTTYYAAVWARDTLGNVSEASGIISTVTLGYGVSADGLASVVTPGVNMELTAVSTSAAPQAPVYAALAAGLEPAQGGFYELDPSGVPFDPPARLTFYFDPAVVSTDTLAIYYFTGVAWASAPVTGQRVGLLPDGRGYVDGYISHSSLYALLYRLDVLPPRAALAAEGVYLSANGTAYVTGHSTCTLTSSDDLRITGDGAGYGVREQRALVSGAPFSAPLEYRFINPVPARGRVFISTFTLGSAGDGPYTFSYGATDVLGEASVALTALYTLDNTPPVTGAVLQGTAGRYDWYLSQVQAALTAEDAGSGVAGVRYSLDQSAEAAYGPVLPISADGEHSLRFHAVDRLGNAEENKTLVVKIDRTAPEVLANPARLPNAAGWYNAPVNVEFNGADAVSGVAYCVAGATAAVEGAGQRVSGYCMDFAGWSSTATVVVNIDTTAPSAVSSAQPLANAVGWNKTPVEVTFSGADALSGLEYCVPAKTASAEGADITVSGYCLDKAGNTSTATAHLNIDLTPAVITITSPTAGQTFVASRGRILIDFGVKDNLDPAPAHEAHLVQVEDKGSPRGQRPVKIAVVSGQAIEPLDIDDGLWRLTVSAEDLAGNSAVVDGGVFEVVHDMLPPSSALTVNGPLYGSAGGNYIASAAMFALSSLDDLVSTSDGAGPGVKSQAVVVKSAGVAIKEFSFLNPAPQPGVVFVSSFSLGSITFLPDGAYDISYGAQDLIGNSEVPLVRRYLLDNTPPATQYSVAGASFLSGGRLYINSAASLGLAGVDISSGGVASGVMAVKHRLDSGVWGVYASTFAIASAGAHTLEYYSLDNVQNAESLRTLNIVIDNTAPVASISVGEPQFNVFGLRIITPGTPLTLAAADLGEAVLTAGVKTIAYELIEAAGGSSGVRGYTEPFKIAAPGTYTLRYWAEDNAGNSGAPQEARLMVSSLQSDALDAVEGLTMTGSADIAGTVKSNKVVSLGGNARILGDVSASTITVTGNAQITGQRFAGAATLTPAPLYMPAIVAIASSTNNNGLIPAKYLVGGKLVVSAKDEIILSTGIYYLTGIELKGGASVVLNGKVDILVAGDVAIGGGSSFNAAGTASRLNIFLSTASTLNFGGGASLAAYVYAPYAELKLAGNALLGGHYFVRSAAVSGTGNLVQAGETLPAAVPVAGGGKKVSALASGSSYSVLAGPDPEFKLGEVYVYPNPAKNGQVPTIHLECGIADSVNIKIYTVSGREAHEYNMTSAPAALDDGNGLSYAYEYAWNGRIPSGVYYYFIEAERAGKKIKKTGKFAVVR